MITVTACPVCGGTDLAPVTVSPAAPGQLHTSQACCRECRLLMAQPRASGADIAAYYARDYYEGRWSDAAAAVRDNTAAYRRFELPLLRRLWAAWPPRPGARVVEVGCGYGAMLPLLAELGYQPSGCDPGTQAVRSCRDRGLDVVEGTLDSAPLAPPYALTLCQHVIEHVEDPRAFVRGLVRLTEPGGLVAIVTEDAWNTQWAVERWLDRLRRRPTRFHTSPEHTFVFSAWHLDRLLREAGCDEVRTAAFSYVGRESLHWWLYKGTLRQLDRWRGHGDFLMAVGRVRA